MLGFPAKLPLLQAALLAAIAAFPGQSVAQGTASPPVAVPGPPKAKASPPAAAKAKPETAAAGSTSDPALRQRIESLEEQLVDMQVVVGTLDSFAKSNGAASASPAYRGGAPEAGSGMDQARVSGLEAQVRSLTAQVQQLSEQVRASQTGSQRRSEAAGAPPSAIPAPAASSGFGSTTVQTAPDSIEGVLAAASSPAWQSQQPSPAPVTAAASPPADGANPKQLYEAAYGYLLQQDYGAAETAFDEFLKRYPSDTLAGNAQFWLGESFFVRGQFKPAASAFLKGYTTYGKSGKAPDSLLKLAMSLGRMGQKDAACSSLNELTTRFPAASNDVKSRAVAEKQRTGCL